MIIPTAKQVASLEQISPTTSTTQPGVSPLDLNPRPPRLRRKSSSSSYTPIWKFTLIVTLSVGFIFAVKFSVHSILTMWREWNSPHIHIDLYRPETSIHQVSNKGSVVQPLFNDDDPFDVGVVIYTRTFDPNQGPPWDWDPMAPVFFPGRTSFSPSATYQVDAVLQAVDATNMTVIHATIPEQFRQIRYSDLRKNRAASLSFNIPKDTLCNRLIRTSDLLAALVIIPSRSQPSKLSNITNLSTYLPALSSQFDFFSKALTIADNESNSLLWMSAIQSMSIVTQLLQFHRPPGPPFGHLLPEEGEEDSDPFSQKEEPHDGPLNLYEKSDPYFQSKTYFTLVKETRLLDKKNFLRQHEGLRKILQRCIQTFRAAKYLDTYACTRTYDQNGPFETLIEYEQEHGENSDDGDEGLRRLAYGTYMDVDTKASGAKDTKRLPFDRSTCGEPTQEFIPVNWTAVVSVASPRAHVLSLLPYPGESTPNPNAGEGWLIDSQDRTDLWNGFRGYYVDEHSHPRRRLAIYATRAILGFFIALLSLDYWYRRSTTKGISLVGTTFLVEGYVVSLVRDIGLNLWKDNKHFGLPREEIFLYGLAARHVMEVPLPFLMTKAMLRLHVSFWPRLEILQDFPTHGERGNARMDSSLLKGWRGRIGGLTFLWIVYCLYPPHQQHVISTMVPDDMFAISSVQERIVRRGLEALVEALMFIGLTSQLVLNDQGKVYGGNHKITAMLMVVRRILSLVLFVPGIVGRYESRPALTVGDIFHTILVGVNGWQALWLVGVEEEEEDESEL